MQKQCPSRHPGRDRLSGRRGRARRASLLKSLILCAAAAVAAACDNDTGDGFAGGIGSTTVTATGRITGFGSIFVDGIDYDISGASVTVNEQAAGTQDLKLGMVVTVTGQRTGSNNGAATGVVYDAGVRGPVTAVTPLDAETKRLTAVGKDIVVDENTTVFDNTGFSSLAIDDIIEASGYIDASNRLQATRIEKLGTFTGGSSADVEVSGTVSNHDLSTKSFKLNGLNVFYQVPGTALPTAGITDGDAVEVEGTISFSTPGLINATEIELEDPRLPTGTDSVVLEGIVTDFNSLADFRVNGLPVNAGGGTVQFRPDSLADSLGDGARVAVEGAVSAGVLVAREVGTAGGDIEMEAFVSLVSSTSFNLAITASDTVSVTADNRTQFDDETGAAATTFALAEITAGDYLEVEAYRLTSGDIIASHIKRTGPGSLIELQGPVTDFDGGAGSVEILEVPFTTTGVTTFMDGTSPIASGTFFDALTMGAIVRVEDILSGATVGDGVADEIGLEN